MSGYHDCSLLPRNTKHNNGQCLDIAAIFMVSVVIVHVLV